MQNLVTITTVRRFMLTLLCVSGMLSLAIAPAAAHEVGSVRKARSHVIRRAKSQIGVKYLYGGETPKGFDCSGLTSWAFSGHGAELPRTSLAQYELAGSNGYKRIKSRKNLVRGDLVFFKTTTAKVGHVGIYVGKGDFVSTTSSGGVRIASVRDQYYWGDLWVGATRVPLG